MKKSTWYRDLLVMLAALCVAGVAVVWVQRITGRIDGVAMLIFMLAVFVTSMYTDGYLWGVLASLASVLAVNFAFFTPYFAFNFTLQENLFSGLVMLAVSIMTSTLTTRVKKQEQLRMETEREKMRANLLRAVSHDLRTPLTSIYGACSTVTENYDSLGKEQALKLLREACEDAQWLNRMVENLLSVTRFDGEQVAVKKTPTVLEELLDTVLVKFKKRCPDVPIQLELPEDFVMIPMDSMLIQQVLMNLLENAVLHAEGMTTLTLRVFTLGSRAVFEVKDDGCGIPKERLRTLFSPAPAARTPTPRPTAASTAWALACRCAPPSSRPTAARSTQRAAPARARPSVSGWRRRKSNWRTQRMSNNKYKVLIVEDEANICSFIETLLTTNDYQALVAHTCTMGLTLFASHNPDLVILDLGLPDRDGLELIRTVRQKYMTPIIVLSARTDEMDKIEALDLGANDYITKPFGTGELLARVRVALRLNRYSRTGDAASGGEFQAQGLRINYDRRKVFVEGQEVRLTQTEYNIVAFLSQHAGRVMTYAAIVRAIWGDTDVGSTKKLQVNMANIRKKLGSRPGSNAYILNELGVGYRMIDEDARSGEINE